MQMPGPRLSTSACPPSSPSLPLFLPCSPFTCDGRTRRMWPGAFSPQIADVGLLRMVQAEPWPTCKLGPPVCGFAEMAAIGVEYKTWHYGSLSSPWGPYHKAVDGGGGGGVWGGGCMHLRACTKSPSSRGITWITMGNVLRRDAECRGPEGAEMQLWEDGWGQMNSTPHSERSHHHTGISLYLLLLLPPSLSYCLECQSCPGSIL